MPIGILPIGYIAEHYGVQTGLMTSGCILALTTLLVALKLKAVWAIDTGYRRIER